MSYRGRGGYSERRGRGYRGGGGGYSNRSPILGDRPRRSPEWKRNSSRDNYEREGNWNDRNRDTRREEVRTTRREIDTRDSRRSEFDRERYDDRRDEGSRNGNHFESDFRQKRKYSGERNPYPDTRSERGTNHYEESSTEYPHKRQHFETRGRGGFRGRGDFNSRRDELFRERRSFRDSQRAHSSSFDRSRNTSGHRSERGSDRRNISNFISNIRHHTSPRAATDKSAHVATKEELELESQVIDEKFYETMTLDQRDYIASKALRILVTKPEGQCKLSELEYELMDIKIMFVSSELFMEFLQSFMDDDNVFEIIEAEPEENQEVEGEKSKEKKDTEKTAKGTVQVKKEPVDKDENDKEENNFTNIKDAKNKDAENTEIEKEAENQEKTENTENQEEENQQEPENMDENNDQEEAERDSNLENAIIVGRPKIVFCQKYVTNITSCSKNCGALHICKFFILSKCNAPDERNCCFRHSLDTEKNQEALRLNLLHTFSIDHLKSALKHLKYRNPSTLPPICWFYNTKGCIKSQAGGCPFLHMCEKILKGEKCEKGKKCLLNHDILTNREVLTRFGMWSPEYSKDDLMKVISENYVAHESYAKKFPDSHRDHKDDYYSKSGIQKPKWQLYIPSEEMWMDLTETCHRELESKHRAVVRAKDEYEEALEEMKRFKTSTLIGEKKELPEISNKIFRRLDQESESKSKETDKKVKKEEGEQEEEKEPEVDNDDNDDGKVKVKEETEK